MNRLENTSDNYLTELEDVVTQMLRIKDLADGQVITISNQGQALDGYTELASYRSILSRFRLLAHTGGRK